MSELRFDDFKQSSKQEISPYDRTKYRNYKKSNRYQSKYGVVVTMNSFTSHFANGAWPRFWAEWAQINAFAPLHIIHTCLNRIPAESINLDTNISILNTHIISIFKFKNIGKPILKIRRSKPEEIKELLNSDSIFVLATRLNMVYQVAKGLSSRKVAKIYGISFKQVIN